MRGLRLNILFVSRPGQRTQPLSLIEESYFIVTHVIFGFTKVRVALLFIGIRSQAIYRAAILPKSIPPTISIG